MKINICALSDIGKERTNNEDAIAVCSDLSKSTWSDLSTNGYITIPSLGCISIVADGMGGANAGEIASALAIKSIETFLKNVDYEKILDSDNVIHVLLKNCIAKSNQAILDFVVESPDSIGLGTTIVMLWIVNEKAYIAWCGDSRCYCFNPNTGLKQLTKDHSLVQELVDKDEIKAKEAFNHPDSNIITRCLGDVDADSEPEILTYSIENGDIFLLCSDGLCGYCRDDEIEKVMYRNYGNINECQQSLLQLALKAGGLDNISISLCATLPGSHKTHLVRVIRKIKRFIYRL